MSREVYFKSRASLGTVTAPAMRRAGRSYRVDGTIGRDFVRRKRQVLENAVEFRHKTSLRKHLHSQMLELNT